jgi:hypothetical protein
VSAGTMMLESSGTERPSGACFRPVTAVMVTSEVMGVPELVMNCLDPSITHCPSSRRAVVRVAPASEPASASVRPKAASSSPRARAGR